MSPTEVWITGLGSVTAAGIGREPLSRLLCTGSTGVRRAAECGDRLVGRAPTPRPEPGTRRLDRSARLFVVAAEEAWLDAGLETGGFDPRRTAVLEGSSLGPMAELLESVEVYDPPNARRRPHPTRLITFMTGAGGAMFAQAHRLRGPVFHLSAGSVSASCAIGEACQKIAAGAVDVVVAGGSECPLHREVADSFAAAGILAGRDSECRPFDARRSGTVLGEGSGVLVLEGGDHARRRGVRPWAIIAGVGLSCEACGMTTPDPTGIGVAEATLQALAGAGSDEVGWIKTHGTGTRLNDAAECAGLATVFENRLRDIPLTSLKPALGHCLGASGAVETVGAVLALEQGILPPTLGTGEVDPELPPCTVATRPTAWAAETLLLLSESFGGRCAALVIRRGWRAVR